MNDSLNYYKKLPHCPPALYINPCKRVSRKNNFARCPDLSFSSLKRKKINKQMNIIVKSKLKNLKFEMEINKNLPVKTLQWFVLDYIQMTFL